MSGLSAKLWVAVSLLSLSLPAQAAEKEILLENGQNVGMAVSIYNNNLALVRDTRKADLKAGANSVAFSGVAEKIKPETAMLAAENVEVLEQNYNYNLMNSTNIVDESVGQTVKTALYDEKTGTTQFDTAKIIDSSYGRPILQFSYGIEAHFPGRLIFEKLPENLRSKPTLVIDLKTPQAGNKDLKLAYLTQGISWKADYVADISSKDELNLNGWITLSNESGADYNNAQVQLVAGNVNMASDNGGMVPRPMMFAAKGMARNADMAMESSAAMPTQEALADYYIYTLPFRTDIKDQQSKQVNLLNKNKVKYTKEYRLASPLYIGVGSRDNEFNRQNPEVVFKIVNNQASNLGEPLPKGIIRFYEKDKNGTLQFLGESSIEQLAVGDKADLRLGRSFDIQVKGKVMNVKNIAKNATEADVEVKFLNAKASAEKVVFEQNFGNDWEVVSESVKHEKKNAGTAAWTVDVPANGENVLNFKVRLTRADD